MKQYKVLWLDDEHQTLESIIELAADAGIELIGVADAETGVQELNSQNMHYDAVILDGKFYRSGEEQGARALGNSAFVKVAGVLKEMKAQGKILPWFVLSGQPNFVLDQDDWIGEMTDSDFSGGKIFDKSKDEDVDALWQSIKDACDMLPDTRIRYQHRKVFEASSERYVPEASVPLMKVLRAIHEESKEFDDTEQFNQLRIVLEYMFRAANRHGLLHDKCISDKGVNLNQSGLFMSGKDCNVVGVKCAKTHFPNMVSHLVWDIIEITNSGSHSDDEEYGKLMLSSHRKSVGSPYLLFSLTYRLMDILIWFKSYVDENPDIDKNKDLWVSLTPVASGAWVPGFLSSVHANGWGTFIPDGSAESLSIPPKLVSDNGLSEGTRIQVITKPSPDGTKTFITDIKI